MKIITSSPLHPKVGGVLATALCALVLASGASAQTVSTIQSSARPDGLSIVAPVDAAGTDAASAAFDASILPSIQNLVNTQLAPGKAENDSLYRLDPSKLQLSTQSDVRVYFVGEGAGYHDSLGFNVNAYGTGSGDPKLIFPDASKAASGVPTKSEPLTPGDFVDLGTFNGGSKLDFFLIGNGASKPYGTYSTNSAVNPDHIGHVVAFTLQDSPYLILGFEDLLGGGDRDFNDVVVAIDIGAKNQEALKTLAAAPAPPQWLVLGSFLAIVIYWKSRRAQSLVAA